ncbi:dTDP-4-dehydrorhamnose reductase [Lysobacter humi (ex Lee et al. 2017)]
MKVLLVGAAGQVGRELLARRGPGEDWVATTRTGECSDIRVPTLALDVTDAAAISHLIHAERPDVVLNAAAYTAVDRAESEPELAFAVNARAVEALARACASTRARLVHYSTDYVFDGRAATPYREEDPTSPLGVYGRSKLAGEDAIRGIHEGHLILRTAWVYATHGHNFLRTMLRLGAEREALRVVADQVGCPTPAWLIADVTLGLMRREAGPTGTLHLVCGDRTSWHGFAEALLQRAVDAGHLARMPSVLPITTADYPTPAARPAFSVLATDALQALGVGVPTWREALDRTLPMPDARADGAVT